MEMLLLLVLLMMTGDDRSRESLQSFLRFYRENRELIAAVLNRRTGTEKGENIEDIAQKTSDMQQKDRPREEVGSPDILEEYLKRFAV